MHVCGAPDSALDVRFDEFLRRRRKGQGSEADELNLLVLNFLNLSLQPTTDPFDFSSGGSRILGL